jgi:PTH2 family peptidyl-tRNA hydrolase
METKQVIVLRKDLNMRKGKMVAQGCHASVQVCMELQCEYTYTGAVTTNNIKNFLEWKNGLQTKVCVGVSSEQELYDIYNRAKDAGLPCSLIIDAGKTEFGGVPTPTSCAIGPAETEEVNKITGNLVLL